MQEDLIEGRQDLEHTRRCHQGDKETSTYEQVEEDLDLEEAGEGGQASQHRKKKFHSKLCVHS